MEEEENDYSGITSAGFFQMINNIITAAIKFGHPLQWCSIVHNLYILKKKNLFCIHKLRTIHKLESELNLFKHKIMTKGLMVNTEAHNYLNEDQYGGHNGREALDIVLGNTITFETLYMQQVNFGCTYGDSKACYD
eukprot:12846583-Ditylum_brightwellii.AAC.1